MLDRARRYEPINRLAQITGLSTQRLYDLKPEHWGMPRDFAWKSTAYLFAEASLPELVDALFAAGESDAAIKLRDWLTHELPRRHAEAEEQIAEREGAPAAVAHIDATDAALEAMNVKARRSHASDREQVPHNFLHDWEQDHDA